MATYAFETWDVFTDVPYAGNPLAIVTDASGLSTDDMLRITREFNLSETTFVLPPDDAAHDARVRIFTPGYEMPFAGHPTVGTAICLATARDAFGDMTLELNAGLFPVAVERRGAGFFASFLNPNLPAETGSAPDAAAIERALSLPAGAVARGQDAPRRIGAGGVDFVYARADLPSVQNAKLDHGAFDALGVDAVVGLYLYAEGGVADDAHYHARMFAPNAGIAEDPATGSAAASLPGHIQRCGALRDGAQRWIIEQGFEMGRPSRIEARVDAKDGVVSSVRIGGAARCIQRGSLYIQDPSAAMRGPRR